MKPSIFLFLAGCLGLTACGQEAPKPAPPPVPHHPEIPNQPVDMRAGLKGEQLKKMNESLAMYADFQLGVPMAILAHTEHKIAGSQLSIELSSIRKDTRCAAEAQCVWEGDVEVEMIGRTQGRAQKFVLGKHPLDWNGYRLTMQDVLPHPSAKANPIMPSLVMWVEKAQGPATVPIIPGATPTVTPPPADSAVLSTAAPQTP